MQRKHNGPADSRRLIDVHQIWNGWQDIVPKPGGQFGGFEEM